jgi:lipopolysaccharide export system protein LptA
MVFCCIDRPPPTRVPCATLCVLLALSTLLYAPSPSAAEPAAGVSGGVSATGELPCNEPPMCYRASHLEAERNRVVLYDFDIVDMTRGISHIKADRAEGDGLDFANSRWVLTGHVQMFIPEGRLRADKATVLFASQRIDSMTAEGAPAEFEHALDNGQTAHGHAQAIDFDMGRNEVQLHGDGWLSDGCNEITGGHISYDIGSQRVRADAAPGDNTRVHGTIRAGSSTQSGNSTQCGSPALGNRP